MIPAVFYILHITVHAYIRISITEGSVCFIVKYELVFWHSQEKTVYLLAAEAVAKVKMKCRQMPHCPHLLIYSPLQSFISLLPVCEVVILPSLPGLERFTALL